MGRPEDGEQGAQPRANQRRSVCGTPGRSPASAMSWLLPGFRSTSGLHTVPHRPLPTASASWPQPADRDRPPGPPILGPLPTLGSRELPPFMGKFTTRVYDHALVPMDTREWHNQINGEPLRPVLKDGPSSGFWSAASSISAPRVSITAASSRPVRWHFNVYQQIISPLLKAAVN